MGAQEPYNKSEPNSIIISGQIVTEEPKFYQSLADPIVLVFEHLVREIHHTHVSSNKTIKSSAVSGTYQTTTEKIASINWRKLLDFRF